MAGSLGAAAAGLYRGSRDSIVGFGLLGGSSYVYGNLYSPPPYLVIYASALDAATCVDGVARQAAGSAAALTKARRALLESVSELKQRTDAVPELARAAALTTAKDAKNLLRVASGTSAREVYFANGIVNVAYEIGGSADQQLLDKRPNLEAFRDASQRALEITQGLAQPAGIPQDLRPATTAKGDAKDESAKDVDPQAAAALESARQVVIKNLEVLADTLKVPAGTDASSCVSRVRTPSVRPLVLLPSAEEIVIGPGTTYSIAVSGGQPPYHGFWVGTEPPAVEVLASRSGDTFRLDGKATPKLEYTYVVRDSGSAEKRIKLKPK